MKKKFLTFLLMICFMLPCALFFSACGLGKGGSGNGGSGNGNGSQGGNEGGGSSSVASPESYFVYDSYLDEIESLTDEGKEASEIVVPSKIDGGSVRRIGYQAFADCTNLTSVVLPDSVKNIENEAFKNCSSLESVVLPNGLTEIERYTFYGCSSLSTITIPDTVDAIGEYAFYGCSSLEEITIPSSVKSVGMCAFNLCSGLERVNTNDFSAWCQTSFGDRGNPCVNTNSLYVNGKELSEEVTIPGTVETIGANILSGLTKIRKVIVSEGVKTITRDAFANNEFDQIILPKSLEKIEYQAFYGAVKIIYYEGTESGWGEIDINSSDSNIKKIPKYFYSETEPTEENLNLWYFDGGIPKPWDTTIYETNGNGKITKVTPYGKTLTEHVIPSKIGDEEIVEISDSVFSNMNWLSSVTIPETITKIGKGVFYGCYRLERINFNAIECADAYNNSPMFYNDALGSQGFYSFKIDAVSLVFGEKVKKVPSYMFTECDKLTSVSFSDSIETIGEEAFKGCTGLTEITIPKNVTEISYWAFHGCTGLTKINFNAINCSDIASRSGIFHSGKEGTQDIVVTFGPEVTRVPAYMFCETFMNNSTVYVSQINLSDSIKEIGKYAFGDCKKVTELTIPNNVETIGNNAFQNCSLTTLTIGEGLETIGNNVFKTSKLSQVNFNAIDCELSTYSPFDFDSNNTFVVTFGSKVEKVPASLFKCSDYDLEGEFGVSQVNFSDSITTIGAYAFYRQYYLSSVTIPKNVTTIDALAFWACTGMTSLTFESDSTLTTIKEKAFLECTSLTSVEIPKSVTTIETYAFKGCEGLTTFTFESDSALITIETNAFLECTSLTEIQIPKNLTTINKYAFKNCTGLTTLTFEEGCLIETIGENAFEGCTALTGLVVPKKLKKIDGRAFKGCTALATLTFEKGCSLQKIGIEAFSGCSSLTKVSIPTSVSVINTNAFNNCTGLTQVYIPGSLTTCSMPFKGCKNLTIYCNISETQANKQWYNDWCYYIIDNDNSSNNKKCDVVYASSLPED